MASAMLLTSCGGAGNVPTQIPVGTAAPAPAATDNTAAATAAPATDNTQAAATAAPAPAGPVTIRTTFGPGEMSDAQIKEFNDANNGAIKVEYVAADDTKLMAMIAAGNAPDIIRIMAVQQLPTYVTRGLCLNIQDYVDKSTVFKTDDFLDICGAYQWDGQKTGSGPIYGFVKDWSLDQMLEVNTTLLNAKGVATPDLNTPLTYSQVCDICSKVMTKNADGSLDVYGFAGWDPLFSIGNMLSLDLMFDQTPWSADYQTASINTDLNKDLLNKINDAVQKGYFDGGVVNPLPGDSTAMLVEGKLAILQMGYWVGGVIRTNDQAKDIMDDILLLPAMQYDGATKRVSPCAAATGAIMLKQTPNPDQAFKVMEWFFAGQPAIDRATSGWGIPAFKSLLADMPQDTNFDKQWYTAVMNEMQNADYIYVQYNPYINSSAVGGLFDKIINPVYSGTSTVDEALPELETQIQSLIQEGMDIAGVGAAQ